MLIPTCRSSFHDQAGETPALPVRLVPFQRTLDGWEGGTRTLAWPGVNRVLSPLSYPPVAVIVAATTMWSGREESHLQPSAHEAAALLLRHGPMDSFPVLLSASGPDAPVRPGTEGRIRTRMMSWSQARRPPIGPPP